MQNAAGKSMAKLKEALDLCAEADLALKRSAQGYIAIEKLICNI
jgi:DNA polymerase III delta subunit